MSDTIFGLGYATVRREGKLLLQKVTVDGTKIAEIWCLNGEQTFMLFDLQTGQNLSYESVDVKRNKYPSWSIWKKLDKIMQINIR